MINNKKRKKEIIKDAGALMGFTIAAPIAASVVTKAGGSAAPITTMTSYAPTMANILGAGMGISLLKDLEVSAQIPTKKVKRKPLF